MSTSSVPSSSVQFDLVGVGAPIMDLVATVPESFLAHAGEKGGSVNIPPDELVRLIGLLPAAPTPMPGGSAANTTFNAARLGLTTTFVGKLGGDETARAYAAHFAAIGVDTRRYKHSTLPNARCLILTTPDAQRTMRTELGAVFSFSPAEVSPADFAGCRMAHVEGYIAFNRPLADAVLTSARAAGCKVSLDLASFEIVRFARDWLLAQLTTGLDLVVANEDEIRELFPELPAKTADDYAAHTRRLAAYGGTAAVKLGKDGAWVARGTELHRIAPVVVADAIDANGAGDAWAAGFLSGYLRGLSLPVCGEIASILGAETVRHMGPVIPPLHWVAVAERAKQHLAKH
ncbi:MAG: adenosine kinase [Verrucomicrobia bacterium]|nr:adenosine kinase [Verrucomicrobiota bacterium]